MKLQTSVKNGVIEANCSELYKLPAQQLLQDVASMDIEFSPGTEIVYGWVVLRLRGSNESMVITAPDIANGNIEVFQDSLDIVLQALVEQAVVLKRLSCEGDPAFYRDKVTLDKRVKLHSGCYLERLEKAAKNDSGWYIGAQDLDAPSRDSLTSMYVYELMVLMPELVKALALPTGYLVTVEERQIAQIYDSKNNPVYL